MKERTMQEGDLYSITWDHTSHRVSLNVPALKANFKLSQFICILGGFSPDLLPNLF